MVGKDIGVYVHLSILIMRNVALLIFGIVYFGIYVRYQMIDDSFARSTVSMLAMSLIFTFGAFLILIPFAHHIKYLEMIRTKRVSVFRICIYGLLALAPPTLYMIIAVIKVDRLLSLFVLLLASCLLILGRALFAALIDIAPDLGLIAQPPKCRADILQLDALLLFLLVIPFIAEALH